jgi:hypothetical protein
MIGAVINYKKSIIFLYKQFLINLCIVRPVFFNCLYSNPIRTFYSSNNENLNLIPIIKVYDLATDKSLLVKEQKNKIGIYLITNKSNYKQYVGSSFNLGDRFSKGYFSLNYLKKFKNIIICSAFLKYDYSNFYVTILEYCPKNKIILHNRETYWIAFFNTVYNIRRIGGSGIGHIHTEEFKIKKSFAANA